MSSAVTLHTAIMPFIGLSTWKTSRSPGLTWRIVLEACLGAPKILAVLMGRQLLGLTGHSQTFILLFPVVFYSGGFGAPCRYFEDIGCSTPVFLKVHLLGPVVFNSSDVTEFFVNYVPWGCVVGDALGYEISVVDF